MNSSGNKNLSSVSSDNSPDKEATCAISITGDVVMKLVSLVTLYTLTWMIPVALFMMTIRDIWNIRTVANTNKCLYL